MQLWAHFAVCWISSGQALLQKYETVMMSLLVNMCKYGQPKCGYRTCIIEMFRCLAKQHHVTLTLQNVNNKQHKLTNANDVTLTLAAYKPVKFL